MLTVEEELNWIQFCFDWDLSGLRRDFVPRAGFEFASKVNKSISRCIFLPAKRFPRENFFSSRRDVVLTCYAREKERKRQALKSHFPAN
jgi:hypothetical protein